jgi:hypothetical protein
MLSNAITRLRCRPEDQFPHEDESTREFFAPDSGLAPSVFLGGHGRGRRLGVGCGAIPFAGPRHEATPASAGASALTSGRHAASEVIARFDQNTGTPRASSRVARNSSAFARLR